MSKPGGSLKFRPTCEHCGKNPAACIGTYEGAAEPSAACDECCAHGCEDGICKRIDSDDEDPN